MLEPELLFDFLWCFFLCVPLESISLLEFPEPRVEEPFPYEPLPEPEVPEELPVPELEPLP